MNRQRNPSVRRGRARLRALLVLGFSLIFLRASFVRSDWAFDLAADGIAAPHAFALARWEVDTLMAKARDTVRSPLTGMNEADQAALVRAYFSSNERLRALERALTAALSQNGPSGSDPQALSAEISSLRRQQSYWRPIAEAAIEQQVATVLRDEHLLTAGILWPPVRFSFTDPPLYLIVSPRNQVSRRYSAYLQPDTPLTLWRSLEEDVERQGEVAALIEGIGGFSTWPTMVLNDASLDWVLSTVAHEWMHTYLVFHPLGWHYFDNGDLTTINETVASIVGDEIGAQALARFYADPPPAPGSAAAPASPDPAPIPFDFGVEMRSTRLTVDALLVRGHVAAAEAFMEARRQRFVAAGYNLRRLNQAYFAFHGSYATGAGAVDPVGPKLQALRAGYPSLAGFVHAVQRFTSLADLDRALSQTTDIPAGPVSWPDHIAEGVRKSQDVNRLVYEAAHLFLHYSP